MRASDVKVALGTDSLASNTSLDMFEEMRAALAASQSAAQLGSGTTAPLAPTDVLRMATIEAAGALGRAHDLGSLEAGKLADLMVLALPPRASLAGSGASTSAPGPPDNGSPDDVDVLEPLIVRKSRGRDVQATIVAGALVFERSRESLSEDSASLHGLEELRRKLGLDAMRHNL
jgi:cytosine/adenosine deaminase-related metal-dependent hydrolase